MNIKTVETELQIIDRLGNVVNEIDNKLRYKYDRRECLYEINEGAPLGKITIDQYLENCIEIDLLDRAIERLSDLKIDIEDIKHHKKRWVNEEVDKKLRMAGYIDWSPVSVKMETAQTLSDISPDERDQIWREQYKANEDIQREFRGIHTWISYKRSQQKCWSGGY